MVRVKYQIHPHPKCGWVLLHQGKHLQQAANRKVRDGVRHSAVYTKDKACLTGQLTFRSVVLHSCWDVNCQMMMMMMMMISMIRRIRMIRILMFAALDRFSRCCNSGSQPNAATHAIYEWSDARIKWSIMFDHVYHGIPRNVTFDLVDLCPFELRIHVESSQRSTRQIHMILHFLLKYRCNILIAHVEGTSRLEQ